MKQEMEDIPHTAEEIKRRKKPPGPRAIILAIALLAAVALFFVPALIGAFQR